MKKFWYKIKNYVLIVFCVFCIGLVGKLDYQDALNLDQLNKEVSK